MDYIVDLIFYTSLTLAIAAAIYGLGLIKRKALTYLIILLWSSAIADIIQAISSHYYIYYQTDLGIRGVGATYRIVEFLLLVFFFRCLKFNSIAKNLMTLAAIIYVVYFISIQPDFFNIFVDSIMINIASVVLVIVFCMLFFKSIITKMEIPNITHWPPFYFMSALFIYFSGVCVSFFVTTSIYRIDIDMGNYIWVFNNSFLIVRNILLIIGFYYTYKTNYKWSPISIP